MLALCAKGHAFYKKHWLGHKVDPLSVQDLNQLEKLPLTRKADLMADPESFRLRIPDLPLHERVTWDVIYTTGSTADPTPVYNTTHDYHAYLFQSRRVAEISGIREDDVIANLLPLTPAPMGAFVRAAANAYAAGAAIFAALPGVAHGGFGVHRPLGEAVRMVERHRASVLWAVPSFLRRVLLRAQALGADFRSVRMVAVTGEATGPAMRATSCAGSCASSAPPARRCSIATARPSSARSRSAGRRGSGTTPRPRSSTTRSSIPTADAVCPTASGACLP
jgi:phenylacetate-coenzyme A ligase PaaK-like adenylate-forming protein